MSGGAIAVDERAASRRRRLFAENAQAYLFLLPRSRSAGSTTTATSCGLDGASQWQLFRRITLPLLWPQIFFVFTIASIGVLRAFNEIFVLTNSGTAPEG